MDNNEQKILELQAQLYRAIKEYYPSLDSLAKKLQDDYNDGVPFVQREEDRLGLCFILDYYDDIEGQIKQLQSDKTITAEEEHKKEVDEATDMITAEDTPSVPESSSSEIVFTVPRNRMDLEVFQVHVRYLLLDSHTGYRSIYHSVSALSNMK